MFKQFCYLFSLFFLISTQCPNEFKNLTPGDHFITIRELNDVLIHIPPGYNNTTPFPIVIALHGMGENYAVNFRNEINLQQISDAENFITVYALGSESWSTTLFGHSWNGGTCCFSSADDKGYLLEVIKQIKELLCEDETKIYLIGFSAGGVISHTMGCEYSDIIAAFISVDGPIATENDCNPKRAVPLMHFHGTFDPIFPIDGLIFNGGEQTIDIWKKANGCLTDPVEVYNENSVYGISYQCKDNVLVQYFKVEFGLHSWPPKNINPEQMMWNFLKQFNL